MKKLLLIGALFISIIIQAQIPTEGLVAYYPFNGNANDESGNSNNGTVNGASLTIDRFGEINSAYSFDGVDDYINVTKSILSSTSTSLSISMWFKSSDDDAHLISDRSGAGNTSKYSISISQTTLASGCEDGNCSGGCPSFSSYMEYPINRWNHVVLIKNKEENVSNIYLNGIEVGFRTFFCYTNFTSPTAIGRGNSYYTSDGYLNGEIDDIRIYNKVLSVTDINKLLNENLCEYSFDNTDTSTYYVSNIEFENISPKIYFDKTDTLKTTFGTCDSIVNRYLKYEFASNYYNDTIEVIKNTEIITYDTVYITYIDSTGEFTQINEDDRINVNFYPNPAYKTLMFDSKIEIKSIEILNEYGVLVKKEELNSLTGRINLSDVTMGAYYLKINTIHGINYQTLIIK